MKILPETDALIAERQRMWAEENASRWKTFKLTLEKLINPTDFLKITRDISNEF
jgi:hypothetical protein